MKRRDALKRVGLGVLLLSILPSLVIPSIKKEQYEHWLEYIRCKNDPEYFYKHYWKVL